MIRKLLTILLLVLCTTYWGTSQTSHFQNLEEVNLSTDRMIYLSGEYLWYSASYQLDSIYSIPLSKLLYVELFDNEGKLVTAQKVAIKDGVANGMIKLSEQLVSGYYLLRAYTRYQENFPVWQMETKIVTIINPTHPLPSAELPKFDDQFIVRIMSDTSVVYRIIGPMHREVGKVNLLVNRDKKVIHSEYYKNGLGWFKHNYAKLDSLQLQIILRSGDTVVSNMISILKEETNIMIKDRLDNIFKTYISNSEDFESTIDTINNPDSKFTVDITEIDQSEYPFTISITKWGANVNNSQLIPEFLINNPQYIDSYFHYGIKGDMITQVKLIMALYGDEFNKNELEGFSSEDFIMPELNSMTIQGKVTGKDGTPISNELVYCSLLGKDPQFHTARTSSNGRFAVQINNIFNSHDVYLGTKPNEETKNEITIENGFCSTPPIWKPTNLYIDSIQRKLITDMYIASQVNKIFNITSKKTILSSNLYISVFGDNLKRIKLSDYIQLNSTPEVINEIVPYTRVKKKDGNYSLIVLDDKLNIKYDDPLLFVDNIPYNNINKLMELQPTEIELIDVASHKYLYGNEEFNGIISISTNTNNFADLPLSDNGVFFEYGGLEEEVIFIPPASNKKHSQPDIANTLMWQTIRTTTDNKLSFKAPAKKGIYDVTITSLKANNKVIKQKIIVE